MPFLIGDGHIHPLSIAKDGTVGRKVLQGNGSTTIVKGEPQL